MNRVVFRGLVVGLLSLAAYAVFLIDAPGIDGVTGAEIARWYMSQALYAAAIGLVTGVGWAFASGRDVKFVPGESGFGYDDRVRSHGFKGLALAVLVYAIVGATAAAVASFVPRGAFDRIVELVLDTKFLGSLAAAGGAMGVSWGATLRIKNQEGSRALLP